MKRFYRLAAAAALAAGALSAAAGTAAATGPTSLTTFTPHVMPVLVRVDAHGKVTKISPSSDLSPAFERLLERNLRAWISKPALENGRPISREMIVNVALHVAARGDGKYDASFACVSSSPSPYISSHWVTLDGTQLALADDHGDYRGNRASMPAAPSSFQRSFNEAQGGTHGRSTGVARTGSSSAPASAAAHGR